VRHLNFYKVEKKVCERQSTLLSDTYWALHGSTYTQVMAFAFKMYKLKVGPELRMLEAGCGHGKFSAYWSQFGCECDGVDIDPKQLDYSRKLCKICSEVSGLDIAVGFCEYDIRKLTEAFNPAKYDVVYNEGVLEHFPHDVQIKILQEMANVSRNLVLVFVPDGDDPKAVEFAAKTKHYFYAGKGGMKLREKPIKGQELRAMLQEVGLKNITTWKMNEYIMGVGQK
jgi:SAM-dependent methyltransferase